ncbi:TetR/AcrR family transcriptional regulator C-terminal domain-containing protein [Krasilnikovia sp. MM14-A1004]|uniref:TetR/AcrR family transcriptional regulator C-terminal domain-containing protein n=1 Tax=Krasilnikovia sp. MM14-A1004 TaxID=3373541 RepID=UPI00399C7F12
MTEPDLPSPPWRPASPRRPRAARPPLSRDQIVEAGLRIVAAEGVEAASMRRVAAEFDTGPSSLYAHVANRDELLDLMFDRACAGIEIPEPDPARWPEQVKQMARDGYTRLMDYRDLARAALSTVPTGPNALRITEGMMAVLLAGGVPPRIAGWALDRIFLYMVAEVYESSLRQASIEATGKDPEQYFAHWVEQLAGYYESLPPEHFPNLHHHAREITGGGGDERFLFGLDLIVDGLARYVQTPAKRSTGTA